MNAALLAAIARQALYAAAVFLLVAPLCALLARRWPYRAARLRSALWALVLLRLLLPPDLAVPWSARALLGSLAPTPTGWEGWMADESPLAVSSDAPTAANPDAERPLGDWLPGLGWLALCLWGMGTALQTGVTLSRRSRFGRLAACATPLDAGAVGPEARSAAGYAERWRRRLGVRRCVRLVSSEQAVLPFTLGLLRPVLFVPAVLLRRAPESLEAVIAHEMAHIARWDDLRIRLQRAVQCLWFFHPVAWLAGARLDEERERLCDARVLASGALSPQDYGRSLLAVVRLNLRSAAPLPAFGPTKGRTAMRIREIVQEGRHRPRALPALAVAVVVGLFVLPLAPASDAATGGAGTSEATGGSQATGSSMAERSSTAHAASHSSSHAASHGEGHAVSHAASHSSGSPSMGHGPAHGVGSSTGSWELPVRGAHLTSPFGERVDPMTRKPALHSGVDLGAPEGTPIVAPAAGRVTVATERFEGGSQFGTVVVVEHEGGLQSFYSHLGSLAVTPGQEVARGQQLGTVGSTGAVTGPHLHFEIRHDGEPVDPGDLVPALRH